MALRFDNQVRVFSGDTDASAGTEERIRRQVAVMEDVQSALWSAYSKWKIGHYLTDVAIPAIIILQIGKFDYEYAINAWQESADKWWSTDLTDAVRNDPSRMDSWSTMGAGIIEWAQRIATEMKDDTALKTFTDFLSRFKNFAGSAIPDIGSMLSNVKWIVLGGLGLYLLFTFRKK